MLFDKGHGGVHAVEGGLIIEERLLKSPLTMNHTVNVHNDNAGEEEEGGAVVGGEDARGEEEEGAVVGGEKEGEWEAVWLPLAVARWRRHDTTRRREIARETPELGGELTIGSFLKMCDGVFP